MSQTGFSLRLSSAGTSLLNAPRLAAWSGLLLGAECLTLLFFIAGTHGLIVPLDAPVSTDYVSFYAAGKLAAAGTPALAYDQAAHHAAEQAATEPGIGYVYFFYPPVYLLLCRLLVTLPYLTSYITFQLVTGVTWLLGMQRILQRSGWTWLLPCVAFPAVFWNIGLGQNAFLTASIFAFATCLLDQRPWLAGLLFGALCYKPHFGLLIPLALIAGRRWRAIAGAGSSVVGLVLLSVIVFGRQSWLAFLHVSLTSRQTFEAGKITFAHLITPFGAARLAGLVTSKAYLLQAAVSVCVMTCVALLWWRADRRGPCNAALIIGTLLSVPVALTYDLVSIAVAAAWLVGDAANVRAHRGVLWLLTALFLIPLFSLACATAFHIQLTPLALVLLLAVCVQRGRYAEPTPSSEVM